jgi:3-oxoacyl-[acyl-carrier protein] reductase
MANLDLSSVVVSGAAAGTGRAVARRFLSERWRVIAVDQNADALEKEWGAVDSVHTIAADITDEDSLTAAFAEAPLSRLRACINVAGVYPSSTFMSFTTEDFRTNFEVNVLGTLLMSRACVPYMRSGGAILNFSSIAAFLPGDGIRVLYKAAKAALVSLTRSMAFELADYNIVVNALAPGAVETNNARGLPGADAVRDRSTFGRLAKPEEIAAWTWALAGEDRLPYVTGETIVVSGGAFMRP